MKIHAESYGRAVILILEGELTEDSLGAFKQAVDHQLKGAQPLKNQTKGDTSREVIDLVLNLEKMSFIDSVSLEYLLDLQELLAERLGQVKFVKANENVRKILEITRLESTFEIFDEVPEAMNVIHR